MGKLRAVLAPLAAAASVAVITVGVSQWLGGDTSPAGVYVGADGLPTAASTSVQGRADKVFESFNGTVKQREAAGVLQAWALNRGMDACMEEAGFPEWDWSATRNGAPRTNGLGTSKFFARPLAAAHSNALSDVADTLAAERELRVEVLSEAEDTAVGECLERTPSTSDSEADAFSTPEVVAELRSAWWSMLSELDEDLGDASTYESCIATQARALGEGPVSAGAWQRQLNEQALTVNDFPVEEQAGTTGVAWDRFTDLEAKWEQKDWGCRRDTYGAQLGVVKAAVEKFAREHAADIERAQAEWREVVRRAEALGFRGQTGSLDPAAVRAAAAGGRS